MKRPKIIMHNTVSIDSSTKNFDCDIGLHYEVAGRYQADATLIGSTTAKSGLEIYLEEIPLETESDLIKKEYNDDDKRPFWVILDTKGKLYGLMHIYRRFEYCKEVIILLSKNSPEKYIKYLKERNYEYIISDTDPIDFSKVMDMLYSKYKIKTMLTDTGETLNSILLEKKLIDEISLIIAPTIVGKNSQYLFGSLSQNNLFNLKLRGVEVLDKNYVLIKYDISY